MCAHRNRKQGQRQRRQLGKHWHRCCTMWTRVTQTHHKTHEHTKHTGLLHSQPFLLHSQHLRHLYSQGLLCIAGSMLCMMLKHRQQPAQKHTDSKASHSMAQGLNNMTAKHGFGRCGMYTMIYLFFSSTCQIIFSKSKSKTCDLDTANNKEAANMQQLCH